MNPQPPDAVFEFLGCSFVTLGLERRRVFTRLFLQIKVGPWETEISAKTKFTVAIGQKVGEKKVTALFVIL